MAGAEYAQWHSAEPGGHPRRALLVSAMHLVVISVMADLSCVLFLAPMQRKEF